MLLNSRRQCGTLLEELAPGGVTALSGPRSLHVAGLFWTLGQNLYLGLQDGGWSSRMKAMFAKKGA